MFLPPGYSINYTPTASDGVLVTVTTPAGTQITPKLDDRQ
jgi:histone deacetylase complex regulatory component SIN3